MVTVTNILHRKIEPTTEHTEKDPIASFWSFLAEKFVGGFMLDGPACSGIARDDLIGKNGSKLATAAKYEELSLR